MFEELSFWMAVGLVSIVALFLFKFIAAKLGGRVPALASLATFI